jgi:hypothetical protein
MGCWQRKSRHQQAESGAHAARATRARRLQHPRGKGRASIPFGKKIANTAISKFEVGNVRLRGICP